MIDYPRINSAALAQFHSLLASWLPGGRIEGKRYICADLTGRPGRSLSVNTITGEWKDFPDGPYGSDPVSLYAAIHGMKQGEAARELAQKLGIEADTGNGKSALREGKARITATYDYLDANGNLVFQVCRMKPKSFRQRRPDGAGGWTWSVKDVELVPYQLPDILEAEEVFICEGEKDCNRLASLGLTATCNAQGAGKWRDSYAKHFTGKAVFILPDNDDPGRKHAQQVARSLQGKAKEVRIVDLPGLPEKGDVSDFLDAGGTVDQLHALVQAAPEWTPGTEPEQEQEHALDRFNPLEWTAARFLDGPLEPLDFVFQDSLPTATVGAVCGPQGAGKGHLILHAVMGVATGEKAFLPAWGIPRPRKVLVLAAEDDLRTLQRRCRAIADSITHTGNLMLHPDRVAELLRQNLHIYPLSGSDLKLIRNEGGNPVASPVFDKLRKAAGSIPDLGLLVLDPLSRWHGGDENDNNVGTTLVSLLEQVKEETGATVLIVHHVSKRAGWTGNKFSLDAALHMDAMRGASAISGGIRWQMNLTPLPAAFAKSELGMSAPEGTYLACRVSKKNHGAPEGVIYLERKRGGVLAVLEQGAAHGEIDVEQDIQAWLCERIAFQADNGLPGLTIKGAADLRSEWEHIAGATKARIRSVAEAAVLRGDLILVTRRNSKNRLTEYLELPPEEGGNSGQESPATEAGIPAGIPAAEDTGNTGSNSAGKKDQSFQDLHTGRKVTGKRVQENPAGMQPIEIIDTGTPATPSPLRGEEEHLKVPPPSTIPAGETIPKEVGNITSLSSTETPKTPPRRLTSTTMTTPKAPRKFTPPAREIDQVPF